MHARTWSIILSLPKTTPSCLRRSHNHCLASGNVYSACSIEAARQRQEEPLTFRSQFTTILQFPHTHNEGERWGPTTREIFFLFFKWLSSTHRPRRSEMSILPVFLCPYKNSGNAKNAHRWQLLPADLLKRCDDHEWKHYAGYTCKVKAGGEVSLISQLFLLNEIKCGGNLVSVPGFYTWHCFRIDAFVRQFLLNAKCIAQGFCRFYEGKFKTLRPLQYINMVSACKYCIELY